MNLIEAENAIIEEFSMYEEWLDKYEYLIELGKSLNDYPESAKTDDRLIKGCQSRVWLDYRVDEGRIYFKISRKVSITTLFQLNNAYVRWNCATPVLPQIR